MMLSLKEKFGAVYIDVNFRNRVNILSGFSGTGKTFLLSFLGYYCLKNNLCCSKFNSSDLISGSGEELLKGRIGELSRADIICLDNADLYLKSDLFNELIEACDKSMIFISMHYITTLKSDYKDIGVYFLSFRDNMLKAGV